MNTFPSVVFGSVGRNSPIDDNVRSTLAADVIVANAPDPVFVCDLRGKILEANAAVSQLLGLRRDEVLEQSVSRFVSPEETREFIAGLREVVERGVTRNVRLNPRSASGEVIPTTLNASALRDPDGTVIGAIGILRDMRAYERVVRDLQESRRELREADKAKDQFLAIVSHELRTPLTAMLGWARLLRTGTPDAARAARGVEVIERNTKLLAQLIEDLLDVSRIVTGKLRLERRPVDPVAVVESAIEAVQGMADAKDIELEAVLDPDAGPVLADPDRLQQVVWNLLSNAIKFSPAHGLVGIRLEHPSPVARLTVSDTGPGIKPELLPHVFERFRQGERASGGLGLGLAIVRHIVDLHGGVVRAQSAGNGQGATFTVELPTLSESGTVAAAAPHGGKGPLGPRLTPLQGFKLLLVDDDPDARELLGMILQEAGAQVATAGSADEALEAFSGCGRTFSSA